MVCYIAVLRCCAVGLVPCVGTVLCERSKFTVIFTVFPPAQRGWTWGRHKSNENGSITEEVNRTTHKLHNISAKMLMVLVTLQWDSVVRSIGEINASERLMLGQVKRESWEGGRFDGDREREKKKQENNKIEMELEHAKGIDEAG